jgi:hypothetical protein
LLLCEECTEWWWFHCDSSFLLSLSFARDRVQEREITDMPLVECLWEKCKNTDMPLFQCLVRQTWLHHKSQCYCFIWVFLKSTIGRDCACRIINIVDTIWYCCNQARFRNKIVNFYTMVNRICLSVSIFGNFSKSVASISIHEFKIIKAF